MTRILKLIRVGVALTMLTAAATPTRAQQAPLQDKPFAEHKVVLQLSDDDPRKQRLVLSVASNLMKFYDPDKVAVEIVAFGPGIDLLKPENPNRKLVESSGRTRRACRHLPQHRRYGGARYRQAAGIHRRRNAGPGRSRADPAADGKRVYVGQAMTVIASYAVIASEAKQSIAPQKKEWIASLRSQ